MHRDLDRLFACRQLRGLWHDVHRLGRRAAIGVDGEKHAVCAAARRYQLKFADLLLGIHFDPDHEDDRRTGLFYHHACDGLACALVENVLPIAAQLGDRPYQTDLVQRLLRRILRDPQDGRDRKLADVMLHECVEHLGDLAAQALAVASRRGGRQGRRGGDACRLCSKSDGWRKDQCQRSEDLHCFFLSHSQKIGVYLFILKSSASRVLPRHLPLSSLVRPRPQDQIGNRNCG